jgi:hypothetical protein
MPAPQVDTNVRLSSANNHCYFAADDFGEVLRLRLHLRLRLRVRRLPLRSRVASERSYLQRTGLLTSLTRPPHVRLSQDRIMCWSWFSIILYCEGSEDAGRGM